MSQTRKIYFDYAASTPVNPEVLQEMHPYFSELFANPGSTHYAGRMAQAAVDNSRERIAQVFGVDQSGVIFLASATEANNLVLRGAVKQYKAKVGRGLPHIIVSVIEHESVLDTARDLEQCGEVEVTYVPVNSRGFVEPDILRMALRPHTILVSVMAVNNVTGAIQPISEIGTMIREFRQQKLSLSNQARYTPFELQYPLLHTDAAQIFHTSEKQCDIQHIKTDMVIISSHKICGPKGAGALILKNVISNQPSVVRHQLSVISPVVTGGGQEFGFHSGTENVPVIVGFAKALEITMMSRNKEVRRLHALQEEFVKGIRAIFSRAVVNSFEPHAAGIFNVSFPGFTHDELLYKFDREGIAISIGSACHAKLVKPSYVLVAMGVPQNIFESALRFSFGSGTTKQEITYCLDAIKKIIHK